jgi:hypothetical protein
MTIVRHLVHPAALLFAAVAAASEPPPGASPETPVVMGWLETVRIHPGGLSLRGKLDTGAKNSSINATNVEQFEREGESWVRFTVTNNKNKSVTLEREVVREVRIRRAGVDTHERPAVLLDVCVGSVMKRIEVNLADRSDQNYQLLLGRSFLQDSVLVDASRSFRTKLRCPAKP